jgi:hypothetical protein
LGKDWLQDESKYLKQYTGVLELQFKFSQTFFTDSTLAQRKEEINFLEVRSSQRTCAESEKQLYPIEMVLASQEENY